ncbi:protein TIME FOR COFFEE [Pistacia vera]|uniref:protein TIME FOR COFFEE n=1 Tax=Pistacia vera TaxID=55513 RepID=UPI00126359A1|nr:protein TIME FOR COFFEE [Pistacia vera]
MERSREARRGVTLAASNGLSRRRHRSSSLRDSPEEDGPLELQETARLRDRKKDRDRDRDRDRERDRERDRMSRSSKRRRSDKFMLGTNRDDGGDDSSEESVNDDEEDDDDDGGGGGGGNSSMRMLPPNPSTSSSSMLNHHHHHHHHNHNSNSHSNNNHNHNNNNHNSRKSFPPPAKVFRTAPTATTASTTPSTWKAADEMIGVSVPRKARSASTKRSHECWTSSGGVVGGGEQIHRQASSSPVRTSVTTVLATPAPASPSSSNFSVRKKMKPSGPKLRPPKSSSNKSSSSAQDEIEIEIAEVLYGMMRQPQGPSKQEIMGVDSNSKEINNNKSTSDSKSRVSSPISNSPSTLPQSSSILPTNSSSSTAPMSAIAPKRKRPRPVKYEDENPSSFAVRNVPISSTTKAEMDQSAKTETCSPNLDKNSGSAVAENGSISYDLVNSQASEPKIESVKPESNVLLPDSKGLTEESESGGDVAVAKDGPQRQPLSPKKESTVSLRLDCDRRDNLTVTKANSTTSEIEKQREEKFQIDLMAPPPLRSSPERDGEIDFVAVDVQTEMKPMVKEDEKVVKIAKDVVVEDEQKKAKAIAEESESQKPVVGKERIIDLQLDLEKSDRDSGTASVSGNKLQQHVQKQQQQPPPLVPEKKAPSTSLPLPLPMASWPGGLPPMGYMAAPLQGVVSMDGSAVSSAAVQPPNLLFSQPRPKRCATHCYIARSIHYLQQFTRMNPFWPAAASSASLYGAKACNLNVGPPTELHGTVPGKGVNNAQDKGQGLAIFPGPTGKDNKGSQHANLMDAAQRKQVLLQQALPPGAPSNMLAPTFIFPLSQQQAAAAAAVRPGSVKSPPAAGNAASSSGSNSASMSVTTTAGAAATAMGFNYQNIPGSSETQTPYLAILQNNAYPFPMSAHMGGTPAYRGTPAQSMPFFNGSFYPSQMLHHSQLQQQQQQQQSLPAQSHQSQQGHQNASISSGSSSSQKHLKSQHPRPHNSGISGGNGTLQSFPAPPPLRSSPERDGEIDFVAVDVQTEMKPMVKEDEKVVKIAKDVVVEDEQKKAKTIAEESESQKPVVGKERIIDLQLDLEKSDRDSGTASVSGNKLQQHVQKQQQQPPPLVPEKNAPSTSLPLPLPMASWPGGLPPMGYMAAPLQGVVSMDGSAVSSAAVQPPNLLFSQPRPKRCATHCYIARSIHYLQQFTRMNPFWPAAASSASLYGAKACNLNVGPPTELHGTVPGKGVNNAQDKGQGLAIFPGPTGKDNKGSQHANLMDAAQRKQVLLQQALPPGAPSNMLAPTFIFPLSQQQAAAAAAVRPGSVKSPPAAGNAASSSGSNSASMSVTTTAGAAATAMGFNYQNIPGSSETQTPYLAILQNNAYPFPMSAHMGGTPAYRGTPAQSMPFFNGSFYPSQMLHHSQLQQQQQQQQSLPAQSHQSQQGHQNASISSGSSSSQKHLKSQHPRPHNSGISGGNGTLQSFPAPKNQPQQLQLQQRQQQQNQQVPHQARQLENEITGEESPSTADSRISRGNMSIYGQNFAMPLHSPNFALMTPASMGGATSVTGNHGEKKPQQQLQQQGSKAGVETMTPQTFAMTFASINGPTAPGLDLSTIAQNPAILQNLPEAMRQGYQFIAAAQAAQQKKNYRVSEEAKAGGSDTSNVEEERKAMAGKPPATVVQSIAFSRPDLSDAPVSMTGNTVIDGSTRSLNHGSAPARTSVSVMPSSISNVNASSAQQQLQRSQQQQQQQQLIQLQKQQQFAAAARSKTTATSNGSVYPDHLQPSSSMAAKFPGALSVFPQNLVQNNSSSAQSQWKNSGRTSASQVSSQSLAPSTTSSLKNLPQQQGRTQQSHTQISFAANPKSSSATHGQPPSGNNQSTSPPMVVGSPTTSSISKTSAGGSPRTNAAASTGNKSGQASSLSSQQAKNSPSMPSRKSSPVPSILGNPNITSSGTGVKPQMSQQQQQQQQIPKHAIQQAQMLFSNAYMQAQPQHVASTTSSASAASGFFTVRHHRDQQQLPGSSGTSSTGMLSLCPPVTHSNTNTSDPAKAVAAATNMKGGGALASQGFIHAANFANAQASGKPHQSFPPGFPYVHAVSTAVQVKPAEQKQPAGE